MSRFAGPLAVLAVVAGSVVFASLNGAERVTIDLGFMILRRVPVTLVAFGGLFTGMLVMLGAGIHSDLKVRYLLRKRLEDESQEERALSDDGQRDLFLHQPATEPPVDQAPPTERPTIERPTSEWPGDVMD